MYLVELEGMYMFEFTFTALRSQENSRLPTVKIEKKSKQKLACRIVATIYLA